MDQSIPPRRRLGAFSELTRLPGVANNPYAAVAERMWEPWTQMPFGCPPFKQIETLILAV